MANDSKHTTGGLVLGLAAFLLVSVDFVALKGDRVAGGMVDLSAASPPLVLEIERAGVAHLVEITTRKHSNNETKGRAISYQIVGPDGDVVVDDTEHVSRKKRFFEFVPGGPGDYELHAKETTLVGSGRGTGYVDVTVGDRRTISRWLRF